MRPCLQAFERYRHALSPDLQNSETRQNPATMRQTALEYANAGALLAQMYRQQNQRESAVSVWRECFELAFRPAFALPIAKANAGI